jgi:hypothetical protein
MRLRGTAEVTPPSSGPGSLRPDSRAAPTTNQTATVSRSARHTRPGTAPRHRSLLREAGRDGILRAASHAGGRASGRPSSRAYDRSSVGIDRRTSAPEGRAVSGAPARRRHSRGRRGARAMFAPSGVRGQGDGSNVAINGAVLTGRSRPRRRRARTNREVARVPRPRRGRAHERAHLKVRERRPQPATLASAVRQERAKYEAGSRRSRPRCCPGESPANRAPATRQGHLSRRLYRLP